MAFLLQTSLPFVPDAFFLPDRKSQDSRAYLVYIQILLTIAYFGAKTDKNKMQIDENFILEIGIVSILTPLFQTLLMIFAKRDDDESVIESEQLPTYVGRYMYSILVSIQILRIIIFILRYYLLSFLFLQLYTLLISGSRSIA